MLLCETSISPLDLLLDHICRKYALRILRGPNNHPNRHALITALAQPLPKGVGLGRIAHLINKSVSLGTRMENTQDPKLFMEAKTIHISTTDKKPAAIAHKTWARE